jgi:N-acyl-D-amino-acid deacylase
MLQPGSNWENLYLHAGSEGVLIASMTEPSLKPLMGKTVAEIAKMRGVSPEQAVIDLVLADKGRSGAIYFLMKEDNVRRRQRCRGLASARMRRHRRRRACSSSRAPIRAPMATSRDFSANMSATKGRSAARRNTPADFLPAQNLGLKGRGMLKPGMAADVVLFDPPPLPIIRPSPIDAVRDRRQGRVVSRSRS